MTGYVPQEKIDEIRERVDIVHLISEYVALRKAGRNFIGLCPFHKEKTPSFSVRPDKQIFYCFGCGVGGNVFSFLMNINGMTFPEAVRYLAGKTGVILAESQYGSRSGVHDTEREQVFLANSKASRWFIRNLASEGASPIRAYLVDRGISPGVIEAFGLGYAPDSWEALRSYFDQEKIAQSSAEKAGLIIRGKEGSYYDRFRGRLMIPIEDTEGRVVAFGGRILGEGEPKYLNSPESPVYIKGRHLYGLNRSKEFIRKEGYAILVEGYFDLLALWNAGVRPVVAVLGTAMTKEQVDLLRRYTRKVYVAFDSDEAGQKALMRSMEIFLAAEVEAWAVRLSEGSDPDSCVRTQGKEVFLAAIGKAQPIESYFLDRLLPQEKTVVGEKQAVKSAIDLAANIADPIARSLFHRRIAERFGLEYAVIRQQALGNTAIRFETSQAPGMKGQADALQDRPDKHELTLVHLLLENPRRIRDVVERGVFEYLSEGPLMRIVRQLIREAGHDEMERLDINGIIQREEYAAIREAILRLVMTENRIPEELSDRMFNDTVKRLRRQSYEKRRRNLQSKLIKAQRDGDQELCLRLVQEKESLIREEREGKA